MVEEKRIAKREGCPLNQLTIKWDEFGNPYAAEVMKRVNNTSGEYIMINGNPTFNQNIENKKYFPELETWCFLDSNGEEITYNVLT